MRRFQLIFFCLFIGTASFARPESLGLNLKEGNDYQLNINLKSVVDQEIYGKTIQVSTETNEGVDFHVVEKDSNRYVFDVQFKQLVLKAKTPGKEFLFSSDKTVSGDSISAIFSALTHQTFTLIVNERGQILAIKKLNELIVQAVSQKIVSDKRREQVRGQILQVLGKDTFKKILGDLLTIYPNRRVRPGDQWQIDHQIPSLATVQSSNHYTLIKQIHGNVLLKGKGTIETANKDSVISNNGIPLKQDMNGNETSELTLDRKSGWIHQAHLQQQTKMLTQFLKSDYFPRGSVINMTTTTEISVNN